MGEKCHYCQGTHETIEKIKNCMNIRTNIVNSNLIMNGYEGERLKEID